ncbi:MAG: DUF3443 domain-containing protein [Acidobacteriia bacterium]|nr:DUF3443 domain-containing protein [Terriglobia bacterium]
MRKCMPFAAVVGLIFLVGCGGGGGTPVGVPVTVGVSPSLPQFIHAGDSVSITATTSGDPTNAGVTWNLSGLGTLTNQTKTSATYNAPGNITSNVVALVTATAVADSTASGPLLMSVLVPGQENVHPITVDGGPVATQIYPNGVFTSVTVCVPSTSDCQTIDGVLVDTGSYGLRLLSSQVGVALPQLVDSNNNGLNDCVAFVDTSFLWGPVVQADIITSGEIATATSVHLVSSSNTGIPDNCSNGGINENTPESLGANGILGVGPEPNDCGFACDPSAGGVPPEPVYYLCSPSGACSPAFVPVDQQVTNPVAFFPVDNNGDIMDLPPVPGTAAGVDGSLTFGIGTAANNGLGAAKLFTFDPNSLSFTTVYNGISYPDSFIDSGSNGFFFPDASIALCNGGSFYCPPSQLNLSATNKGANGTSDIVSFNVDNATNLFNNNPSDVAFGTLAGPNPVGSFDWGLPFFYGRGVFTAIDGAPAPPGVPAGPFWAY